MIHTYAVPFVLVCTAGMDDGEAGFWHMMQLLLAIVTWPPLDGAASLWSQGKLWQPTIESNKLDLSKVSVVKNVGEHKFS